MRHKRQPPPFASLHRDYDESLTQLLQAAGRLAIVAATAMDLEQVNESVRTTFAKAIGEFNSAYYGDKS